MKTCPTCRSTYPSDFSLCPRDGTLLVEAGVWSEGTVVRGKYRILAKVGQGGMGAVYKAIHLRFGEVRALKVLSAELASNPGFLRRFEQEAVVTRKLLHPNAVRVDDIDESEDGRPFIVMEFIEGRSLRKVIDEEGPLLVPRACAIAKQVASALDAAHRLGMVHRDIKPDNIVLVESRAPAQREALVAQGSSLNPAALPEQAKVLDFGIAKIKEAALGVASATTLTKTDVVIGTPQYMSPEQAMGKRGDELDGRSDIYSLGIVIYQMVTCQLPFKAETPPEVLLAHMHQPPTPIRVLRPDLEIPEPVANVVMGCLEKKRELRPTTAQALIEDLDRAEKGPPVRSTPTRRATTPPVTSAVQQSKAPAPAPVPTAAPILEGEGKPPHAPSAAGRWIAPLFLLWRRVAVRPYPRTGTGRSVAALVALVVLGIGAWYFSTRPSETPTSPAGPAETPPQRPESKPATHLAPASRRVQQQAAHPGSAPPGRLPERRRHGATDNTEVAKKVKATLTEGDLYYDNGEYDNAIAAYQKGLNLEPANAELRQKIQKARNAKAAEATVNQ